MAITRRAVPLLDVTGGLVTLAAVATLGVAVPALLLKAGDAWSAWILQVSTGGQFTQRLTAALQLGGNAAPAAVLVFGLIAIILSLVQAALMLFRQAALVILAGVLPLAAAGTVAPMTRTWIRKVVSWMLALIFYKPAAAAVYAAAFTMIGSGGPRTMLMGFVMLALSVVTLPVLMKFFTWTTGSVAGTGGGGQVLGAAAMGAVAVGAMRGSPGGGGGAGAAQDQAAYLSSRLGPPPGGGPPSAPAGSPGSSGPPPAPSGAASAGPASAAAPPASTPGSAPSGAAASTAPGAAGSPAAAAPAGAATAGSAGAPSAGSAGSAAGAGAGAAPATGAATAAGPAGAAAAAGAQAAAAAARLATGAMEPEDSP